MRFKRGERVLALGNAYGMNLKVQWPLKAVIYVEARCNNPEPPPGTQYQEYYQITFDDPQQQAAYERIGTRWTYPSSLLKRDNYCPVCNQPCETYGPLNLVREHSGVGEQKSERCYGSHAPLEL